MPHATIPAVVVEVPVVLAYQTEAESVAVGSDTNSAAPRIFRRSEFVREERALGVSPGGDRERSD